MMNVCFLQALMRLLAPYHLHPSRTLEPLPQKEHIKENQFLNLVTCLETFLGKGEDVTKTVTCGVSVVLRTTQEERMRLWKRMDDLYDHRSDLTHGSKSIILDADLDDLWQITGDFVASMIQITALTRIPHACADTTPKPQFSQRSH